MAPCLMSKIPGELAAKKSRGKGFEFQSWKCEESNFQNLDFPFSVITERKEPLISFFVKPEVY